MFNKWRTSWKFFFGKWKKFVGKWKSRPHNGILLNRGQTQAFIDLQTCFLVRGKEVTTQYPEISFLLKALGEDGQDWEWFPNKQRLNQDLKTYPYNYQITSFDEGVDLEMAHIQLISLGLRDKSSKDAIVKARISIYNIKTNDEKRKLMSELHEV